MLSCKKTLATILLLALNFPGAKGGVWSGNDKRKAQEEADSTRTVSDHGHSQYGVDVSFPMHHAHVSTNYEWLPHNLDPSISTPKELEGMVVQPIGDRATFYKDFIQGCRDAFGAKGNRCDQTEVDRISMNLRQPQSMQNYTDVGFKSKSSNAEWWPRVTLDRTSYPHTLLFRLLDSFRNSMSR